MLADLNYLAVAVTGVIFFVMGGLWYAAVFGKTWQAALALAPEQKSAQERNFPVALGAHLVSGMLTSFVLANVVVRMGAATFMEGLFCGALMWLGFAFTLSLISMMFERRDPRVFLINAAFYLLAYAVMGGVLAVWR
jgi:hypothetical protein